jgi:hypothetical protein
MGNKKCYRIVPGSVPVRPYQSFDIDNAAHDLFMVRLTGCFSHSDKFLGKGYFGLPGKGYFGLHYNLNLALITSIMAKYSFSNSFPLWVSFTCFSNSKIVPEKQPQLTCIDVFVLCTVVVLFEEPKDENKHQSALPETHALP